MSCRSEGISDKQKRAPPHCSPEESELGTQGFEASSPTGSVPSQATDYWPGSIHHPFRVCSRVNETTLAQDGERGREKGTPQEHLSRGKLTAALPRQLQAGCCSEAAAPAW